MFCLVLERGRCGVWKKHHADLNCSPFFLLQAGQKHDFQKSFEMRSGRHRLCHCSLITVEPHRTPSSANLLNYAQFQHLSSSRFSVDLLSWMRFLLTICSKVVHLTEKRGQSKSLNITNILANLSRVSVTALVFVERNFGF